LKGIKDGAPAIKNHEEPGTRPLGAIAPLGLVPYERQSGMKKHAA